MFTFFAEQTTKFHQILTDVRATRVNVFWLLIGQHLLSLFFDWFITPSHWQQSFAYEGIVISLKEFEMQLPTFSSETDLNLIHLLLYYVQPK